MLKTNRNITITGLSMIGETQAAYMSANISTDGSSNGNFSTTITNETVYEDNKTDCRKDISDFQNLVYAAQDEISAPTV